MPFSVQELIRERDELETRIARLAQFATTDEFRMLPRPLSAAIAKQLNHMKEYAAALNDRIRLMR